MTDVLNLDDLPTAEAVRSIKLNGQTHQQQAMTVGDFIDVQKAAKNLEGADQATVTEHYIRLIKAVFPTAPDSDLRQLTFAKINAIFEFIKVRSDESAEKNGAQAE